MAAFFVFLKHTHWDESVQSTLCIFLFIFYIVAPFERLFLLIYFVVGGARHLLRDNIITVLLSLSTLTE
jgi:hypothetical protein